MAEIIVEVCKIDQVTAHPNADALELCQIKGWQCVVPLGKYQAGSLVTYIPIDSLIPLAHAESWGISKYLSIRSGSDAPTPPMGRVRCARLRGEPSFGVLIDVEDPAWTEGQDVKAYYGITKYIPPLRATAGDAAPPHPLFVEYTDIENLRNFPDALTEGEEVCISEKLHGTSCRVGLVEGEWMAGSMNVRRQMPDTPEQWAQSTYWFPLSLPPVQSLLSVLGAQHRQVILYGEVYGSKIQDLHYGHRGLLGFRAFDLLVDGKYLNVDAFLSECARHSVQSVPILYRGLYTLSTVKALSEGDTTLAGGHIREGVVVKPIVERVNPKVGRVAMKYIGDAYLLSKSADRDTSDV